MQRLKDRSRSGLESEVRHTVDALTDSEEDPPTVVSISDIHGYLDEAQSALLTLSDHPDHAPVVTMTDGELHWADNNHVLVFNGDLVDRGPDNTGVLDLVSRLLSEAPPGRVRVTLGNHEAIALSAAHFNFAQWFSGDASLEDRMALIEQIRDGYVVAAYRGHNVTYAHAGQPSPYTAEEVNAELASAATDLAGNIGTEGDAQTQRDVLDTYERVLGVGRSHLKGPGAGITWLDLDYLPENAPPQVVGHTRQQTPIVQGNVYCQNVIRESVGTVGGECVFVEAPDSLSALIRTAGEGTDKRILGEYS